MSQLPNPMPPEDRRHVIIVPYSQQPEARVEPPSRDSRSPSPDIPPNFVPKAPPDASQFPAASTILNLMERMAGENNIRDLIIVPAASWDRNNSHWEFKLGLLKKQHKKDWAKKEVELRKKYDEEFSDARYRQMLVEKDMRELEFMKNASNQIIFGKTWEEHKAEKQRVEEASKAATEAAKRRAEEYEALIDDLKKKVEEKEAVIKALQSAITGRADNYPPQQQFGNQGEVSMSSQQFMYAQAQAQAQAQGPSRALVVHPRNSAQQAQIHMQPPPRIVNVSHGASRPTILPYNVTPSVRNPPPSAPRDRNTSQDVRGPSGGLAPRNAPHRGYDNSRSIGREDTGVLDRHHNVRGGNKDPRSTIDILPKREYQSDRENRNNIPGRAQELNTPRDGRIEKEAARKNPRTEVSGSHNTRAHHDRWSPDTRAQQADLWRPSRRLSMNDIQTIQRIEPKVTYTTPSQPAAWTKKFVTPPGGVQTKSYQKQGSHPTQGTYVEISTPVAVSKSVSARPSFVKPAVPTGPRGSMVKARPGALFIESSQSDMITKGVTQFRESMLSKQSGSASVREKTVQNPKARIRARSSSPDGRKPTKRRKKDRGVVPELAQVAPGTDKSDLTNYDDIPGSLVDYGSVSDSDTDSSEGYSNPRLRRGASPLFLPKVKPLSEHKKGSPVTKPTSRVQPLYDLEAESDDLFGEGIRRYAEDIPPPGSTGMDTEEVERLIEETDITPMFSDFNSRMPRRIEPKAEAETPLQGATLVKQPRTILEVYDDTKKKSIMVYNSRKFKRVLTINVIPDRYTTDPPGPEYLLNKVRGGQLEYVKSFPEDHSITFAFIHPADAQVFWEFFNKDPDAKECDRRFNVEVDWAKDAIEPLSKLLIDDLIKSSASRMIKVFQCPSDRSNLELKAAFCTNGPKDGYNEVISVKGKKEKTRRKHNGGLGIVAYVECASITYASKLMEAIGNKGYEGFNGAEVEYADDPCAFKDGAPNKVDSLRSW
ncbi:hypothetical protein L873DRAFT_1794382 [Choiromyces venosus 120613-1]|uniref:Uncharacterized protein n=1 Tax=Choiromyces venosus 120613-1 TaxID=1336337 RepID=A0A3N4J4P3_9PEZI|nr:hypothetical protein L873DRAFT_1794382 [Choiromyces venosus 120613-1]